jgi:hypothetical protein
MKERARRQSWRMTRRELHKALARDGRKWIKEVWQAATAASARMDALSPVTTPLGNRLVESYGNREQATGAEVQRALRNAMVVGYATRVVLVDPTGQPTLRPSAFHLGSQPGAARLGSDPDAIKRLLDPVRDIASEQFDSVMTLPHEVWTSYVATATQKLQQQLVTKTLSWRELQRDRIEKMLRYGYALRCLDEAIDAEPVPRSQDEPVPRSEAEPVAHGE